jgi:hypothetical protein
MNEGKTSNFERRLEHINYVPGFSFIKDALINVCDTAETVKFWLEEQGIEVTDAGIVRLTALVLKERERLEAEAEARVHEAEAMVHEREDD